MRASDGRAFVTNRRGNAVFGEIAAFLWQHGFEVYDVATLLPRVRDNRPLFGDVVFARRRQPAARRYVVVVETAIRHADGV